MIFAVYFIWYLNKAHTLRFVKMPLNSILICNSLSFLPLIIYLLKKPGHLSCGLIYSLDFTECIFWYSLIWFSVLRVSWILLVGNIITWNIFFIFYFHIHRRHCFFLLDYLIFFFISVKLISNVVCFRCTAEWIRYTYTYIHSFGDKLGGWDWHIHTAIYKIDNQ